MSKFDNCVIRFKSGDDESFINSVFINGKRIELDEDETQDLEDKYHHTIFHHDHDRFKGYGRIEIINGEITKNEYEIDED